MKILGKRQGLLEQISESTVTMSSSTTTTTMTSLFAIISAPLSALVIAATKLRREASTPPEAKPGLSPMPWPQPRPPVRPG